MYSKNSRKGLKLQRERCLRGLAAALTVGAVRASGPYPPHTKCELLQLAVAALMSAVLPSQLAAGSLAVPALLPAAVGPSVLLRPTQIRRFRMPAVLPHQLGAPPVVRLGVRARPVPVVPPRLHVQEEAEAVPLTAPAIAPLVDVPHPSHRPFSMSAPTASASSTIHDNVRVITLARLDLTTGDVPHPVRRRSFQERADP